jgi:uroporphyrin-III C-methyltransferase
MVTKKQPKLTVLGAGPGDPELFTLKGVKVLKTANVVLYDALINRDLLRYVSEDTELIYVGKRKGHHKFNQSEINNLIVEKALSKGHVVRLKGGDPFVFGRGAEEIAFALNFNITVDIVPGISSSVSVPAYQGIPITKRGVSESFWVITGTTSNNQLSKDVYLAAQSNATVVILMGMSKLNQIVSLFKSHGKSTIPVAIIQNGTTSNEKIGCGYINSIERIAYESDLGAPAIIVIGEVVAHSHKLQTVYKSVIDKHQTLVVA